MNPRLQRAFSLVELLVVVAVIGILAGLLLPALTRAKDQARQGACMNNLRQLGLAAQLYWDDHDGRAFPYRIATTNNGDIYWFGWIERGAEGKRKFDRASGALHPYLGAGGVEVCPSLNYRLSYFKLKATGAAYGYGYNIHVAGESAAPQFKISAASRPSDLAILADAGQVNTFQPPATPTNPMLEEFYYISTNEPTVHFRHGKKSNVLFADGHVQGISVVAESTDTRLKRELLGRIASELLAPR